MQPPSYLLRHVWYDCSLFLPALGTGLLTRSYIRPAYIPSRKPILWAGIKLQLCTIRCRSETRPHASTCFHHAGELFCYMWTATG